MSINSYDLGNLIRLSGIYTVVSSSALIDPTVVKLSTRDPAGTVVTYTYGVSTIVRDSTGTYHADINASLAGPWYYRWWSTGTGQAAVETRFDIREVRAA